MASLPHITTHIAENFQNDASVDFLVAARAASRLHDADASLWGPAARAEASQRLGWIAAARALPEAIERANALKTSLEGVEYSQVLLCGMGGSSLSPQVMTQSSNIPLVAVDSIHPDFIARVCHTDELLRSVIVVSSKSGGTSETRNQLALCEARLREAGVDPAERIVVITDPDSELSEHARLRGYRTVLGHPQVGGRYSALTVFGVVPSVLAGADLSTYAHDVQRTIHILAEDTTENPAIRVAGALHRALEQSGTAQFVSQDLAGLPAWIEQLVAESTGKDGTGLLPIVRDTTHVTPTGGAIVALTNNTEFPVHPHADIIVGMPLASQFFFWEYVTALLCVVLGVNPFDQPDVERTKLAARGMKPGEGFDDNAPHIGEGVSVTIPLSSTLNRTLIEFCDEFIEVARAASYVVIQAFVPERDETLDEIGRLLESVSGTPTAVSYGPEYLHSTGQLHKGGKPSGLFLTVLQIPTEDVPVPGTITSFGWLCASAALADQKVLRGLGRKITGLRIPNTKVLDPMAQHLRSLV